ncbi:MAG: glycosyltransferase [Hymenobacteraceae bacterium]|nr:glycosyltransferase [Hymenobacteraceae bacterium]
MPKWYPNPNDDQDGNFVEEHARALAAAGGQLAVIFGTYDSAPTAPLLRVELTTEHGFLVARAFYRQRLTGWRALDRSLKLVLFFWGLTRAYAAVRSRQGARPALVHVHVLLRTGLWARAYRALTGIPYLITEHWTLSRPENAHRVGWLRKVLSRWVVAGAAGIHTVSDELGRSMRALGFANAHYITIPNVADTALYHPRAAPPLTHPPAPAFALLTVAVFNDEAKNITGLLRVFARFRAEQPSATLTVVGYGPAEVELRGLAAELGLLAIGAVHFTGKLGRPAVAEEMRRATIFTLFSRYENLPCVLIEALASGLPVVATAVGGVPELILAGKTGLLIPSEDEAALLAAWRRALAPDRADLLPAAALRARAEARYSLVAVGSALRAWYVARAGWATADR